MTKDNEIDEQKIIEAINMSMNLPKIKEEYNNISSQLRNLRDQRNFYLSENKLLINKNLVLEDELILTWKKIKDTLLNC
jgi:hypothetical protein